MRWPTAATSSSPASWSISRRPASIPATAPARCRPIRCRPTIVAEIERQTAALARALGVVGLMNVQFAVKDGTVYVLEVNPRASRTVPFVAKATGMPIAKIAARRHGGREARRASRSSRARRRACRGEGGGVPLRALPRRRSHPRAGDEIDRRGDGLDADFGRAFAKSQLGAGVDSAAHGHGLRLGARPRQAGDGRALPPARRDGLHADRDPRHRRAAARSAGWRSRSSTRCWKAGRTSSTAMLSGEVQLVFNTTEGAQADRRQLQPAPHRADQQHPLLHDRRRRPGGGSGDCRPEDRQP